MTSRLRLLVTGANGLVGGRVAELASNDFEVWASSKHKSDITNDVFDLSRVEAVSAWLNQIDPVAIINCGGVTAIDYAAMHMSETTRINVEAVQKMVEWASHKGIPFLQLSTDFVFDGKQTFYSELDAPNPLSHYGLTKLRSEQIVLKYERGCVIRTSLVYGYRKQLSRLNFPLWLKMELASGKSLKITDDQFRSPTYVDDIASGLLRILKTSVGGVLHIAGPQRMNVYEIAKASCNVFGLDSNRLDTISTAESNAKFLRPLSTGLDISKATQLIDYRPVDLVTGIRLMQSQWDDS